MQFGIWTFFKISHLRNSLMGADARNPSMHESEMASHHTSLVFCLPLFICPFWKGTDRWVGWTTADDDGDDDGSNGFELKFPSTYRGGGLEGKGKEGKGSTAPCKYTFLYLIGNWFVAVWKVPQETNLGIRVFVGLRILEEKVEKISSHSAIQLIIWETELYFIKQQKKKSVTELNLQSSLVMRLECVKVPWVERGFKCFSKSELLTRLRFVQVLKIEGSIMGGSEEISWWLNAKIQLSTSPKNI